MSSVSRKLETRIAVLEAMAATMSPRSIPGDNVQFGHVNVAAGLTDHQINFGGIANVDGLVPFVAPTRGYIVWVSAGLSGAAAGSGIDVNVFKNGVQFVGPLTIALGTTKNLTPIFAINQYPFVAGDEIDVRITTPGGWAGVALEVGASVGFVLLQP